MTSGIFNHLSPSYRRRPPAGMLQRGVGMIEVLVAIVILTFGMLGLAGLQTRMLSYSQSSLYRSQATALTDDILDRLRTDRGNAKAGLWNTSLNTASSSVTGSLLYQADLRDWKVQVETLLPSGAASITVTANVVTITIQWDDSRGRETAQQFVTQSQL